MKICFCIDTMESGGAERVASILCNEFADMGHEVDLVMISENEKDSFYPINQKIQLVALMSNYQRNKITFFKKIKELKKHFKNHLYDVVISFLPNVNVCVWKALSKNSKTVHIVSERNNPKTDPHNFIKRFFKEAAFKKADGVVCQTLDALLYYKKIIKKPITVIKNPLSSVIDNTSIPSNSIISVGRLEQQKNFDLLIKAFAQFNISHPESILRIYGSGSLKNDLEALIERLGLSDKVFLCGNDLNWIMKNLDCALFVNSSLYEGMPNSLLEALANNLPCIASDCPIGGSRELLSHNNGLLFKSNDINDLVQKMNNLYKNIELINTFRENNSLIRKEYSSHIIAQEWIHFFREIINESNE